MATTSAIQSETIHRHYWMLVIIRLSDYVEGVTRLQKLAFLIHENDKKSLSHLDFYDDWKPSKFGPFSRDLASDLEYAIGANLVSKWSVKNNAGFSVDRFGLTREGSDIAQEMMRNNEKIVSKIEEIVAQYSKVPLMSLLHDVYYQYPQYTLLSEIKKDVVAKTGTMDTQLDSKYDESED